VRAPAAIVAGDRDPVMGLYVLPLRKVRADWPLSTVEGAGHLNCALSESFKTELKKRLDENAKKKG
jgi:hypothetical protein